MRATDPLLQNLRIVDAFAPGDVQDPTKFISDDLGKTKQGL